MACHLHTYGKPTIEKFSPAPSRRPPLLPPLLLLQDEITGSNFKKFTEIVPLLSVRNFQDNPSST